MTGMHGGVLQSLLGAERRCRVDDFHSLYSGENEFKSQPRDTLSCSYFSSFPQCFLPNAQIIPQIRPRLLPLTSLFTDRVIIRLSAVRNLRYIDHK
jgi:hypothetical protein